MPTTLLLAPWIFRPSAGSESYSSHTPGIAKDLSLAHQEQLGCGAAPHHENFTIGSLFIADVAFVKFSL